MLEKEKIRWIEQEVAKSPNGDLKIVTIRVEEDSIFLKISNTKLTIDYILLFLPRLELLERAKVYKYAQPTVSIMQHLYSVFNDTTKSLSV